jgi:hypothetical protein
MKRFLTHVLLAVILFAGITTPFVSGYKTVLPVADSQESKQSFPYSHQSSFDSIDLLVSVGMRNEQIRLTNLFQQASFRLLPSQSNNFRINYSTQLSHQLFATFRLTFLRKSAFKQSDGYYLYHLRKLLI